jgi:diaminopimelate decarboxylase
VLTYNTGLLRVFGSDYVPIVKERAAAAARELARFASAQSPDLIVLEEVSDLPKLDEMATSLQMKPNLGIRVRVFSRGAGKWEESGGETSKFGINTIQLLDCLKLATDQGQTKHIKMLHFHIGSQISKDGTRSRTSMEDPIFHYLYPLKGHRPLPRVTHSIHHQISFSEFFGVEEL